MEGKGGKEKPLQDIPDLADQGSQARGLHRHRYRDPGQHHLHSQIRRDPPGGSAGPRPLPQPDHVSRADVLGVRRQHQRRRDLRWWRQPNGNLISWIVCLASLAVVIGCNRPSESTWHSRYSDARLKFRLGYTAAALQLAESGYHESDKSHQIWNCKFPILLAHLFLRQP